MPPARAPSRFWSDQRHPRDDGSPSRRRLLLTTVGRVQTPTLAIVVEREEQIRKFISRDYWEIHGSFLADAGEYPGKWFDPKWKKDPDDAEKRADRVWNEQEARTIADAVRGKAATVTEESKPTTQAPPGLFDLTSLQREANGRFGYSAKTTLSIAQSLYERHKARPTRGPTRAPAAGLRAGGAGNDGDARNSGEGHLAPFAKQAVKEGYVKPISGSSTTRRSRTTSPSPTLQAPSACRGGAESLRPGRAPLPRRVLAQREYS